MNKLQKLFQLSWHEKLLLFEALLYLIIARTALLIPFNHLAPFLGKQFPANQIQMMTGLPAAVAQKIGWSVEVMSTRTPWESACLAQAIAAKLMLKRRGIKSLMYLGMKKEERGNFMAHAWLQSGNEIILGGANSETFSILSAIGDVPEQVENV